MKTNLATFDHPLRAALNDELHSRPFLSIEAPARISYFVVTHQVGQTQQEPFEALGNLCRGWDVVPPTEPTNYFVHDTDFGLFKWERHTEFSTFTILEKDHKGDRFGNVAFDRVPQAWLELHQPQVLTSAVIYLEAKRDTLSQQQIEEFRQYFVPETFAVADVLETAAYIMTDFRTDANGHVRFIIQPFKGTGSKRTGRVIQRVIEIETYKSATMLALPAARNVSRKVPMLGRLLPPLLAQMDESNDGVKTAFAELLEISSQTEKMVAATDYRFSAAEAYSRIVDQRLGVLREKRVAGFQMMSEFLLRRFDPSVRTIRSSRQQLRDFSERVERAANLLRTQIDVNNANAQQDLLHSMDRRAETQLRLQETVEGFSVVAISYYAVSLLSYLGAPLAKSLGIDKSLLLALAVAPTVLLVWFFINRIKKRVAKKHD